MPKIIIHAPEAAFDAQARKTIAADLTDFALDCERLPKSPYIKGTVWIYFNAYPEGFIFSGHEVATKPVISMEIFTIVGGLNAESRKTLIVGATEILGRQLPAAPTTPVYIVVHEVAETNWGIFGRNPDLAALRASAVDAPAN